MVQRSFSFNMALGAWLFAPAYFALRWLVDLVGYVPERPWELWLGALLFAVPVTWVLVTRVSLFRRMSDRMSQWGLGVAQLTFFAYVIAMPIYLVTCSFDRGDVRDDQY